MSLVAQQGHIAHEHTNPTRVWSTKPLTQILLLIREVHTSKVAGDFGVQKIVAHFYRYVYWARMQVEVVRFTRGCKLCYTCKWEM